jgi:hypothetical protein
MASFLFIFPNLRYQKPSPPPLKREIFVKFTIQKQTNSKISQLFVINFLIKKTLNLSQHQGFKFSSLFFFFKFVRLKKLG